MPLDRENSATLFDCQHELAAAYLASQVGRSLFVPTSLLLYLFIIKRTAVREGSALRPDPTIAKRGRQLWATSQQSRLGRGTRLQTFGFGETLAGPRAGVSSARETPCYFLRRRAKAPNIPIASIEIVAGSGTGASRKLWLVSRYGVPAMKVGLETLPV